MANWIYFSLIAQGIWAFTSLIDKIVISKGYIKSPFVYIISNGLMNLGLIFLMSFVGFKPLKFMDFLIALFSGLMLSASVIAYYKAVQYDEISKIKIMFQMEPILVLMLSFIFLGNVLTKNQFIGFIFLICAGIIISYKKEKKLFKLSKAFYPAVLSIFFGALYVISAKHIYSITGFWSAFLWLRLTSLSALFVLIAPSIRKEFAKTIKQINKKVRKLLLFKMIIDFSAFIFAGYALLNGPVSLVVVLESAVAPLFIFILTLLTTIYLPRIIKEEVNKKAILTKLFAIISTILGLIFVNL